MRLGVDATPLAAAKSGIGYHVEYLVRALAKTGALEEILLFANKRPLFDEGMPSGTRWVEQLTFAKRAIWMQLLLPELIRREKPDLTHYINFNAPIARTHPFVVTFHDMVLFRHPEFFTWKKRVLTRGLMPLVARRALGILTVTEAARREIIEYLDLPPDRVHVVPAAPADLYRPVDDPAEIASVRAKHKLSGPYLLFVGTLEPRKNLPRLLQAFEQLRRSPGIPHQLAIVGGRGWKFDPIFQAIDAMAARDDVRFLDYVPLPEMPALYAGADLLVFPSLYEGFGVPPLEAMRVGTPVVVSDIPSLREVTGHASIKVDPFDERSIASGIVRGLDGADLASRRAAGLARAADFTWDHAAEKALQIYELALGREGSLRTGGVERTLDRALPALEAAAREADPSAEVRAAALRAAVLRTLAYAAIFRYPLTPAELHHGLIGEQASRAELDSLIEGDAVLHASVERHDGYVVRKGEARWIEARRAMFDAHDGLIRANAGGLHSIARLPYLRFVAFSGGTAHRNSPERADLDLFVVTAPGRLFCVYAAVIVRSRLLGKRHLFCANYIIDETHLEIAARDLYTAHQLISLRPLEATPVFDRLLDHNLWTRGHFPNATPWPPEKLWRRDRIARAAQRTLELLLSPLAMMAEPLLRQVLLARLERKRRAQPGSDVILSAGRLKMHFKDLKTATLERFASDDKS